MSWDADFLGARASRPHKAWQGFPHLPHFDQPGTAPLLPFRLADAVSGNRVAACRFAPKLSGRQATNPAGYFAGYFCIDSPEAPAREDALAGKGCGRDARAPRCSRRV